MPDIWTEEDELAVAAMEDAAAHAYEQRDYDDNCPQVGKGGHHSKGYYEVGICHWCGAVQFP